MAGKGDVEVCDELRASVVLLSDEACAVALRDLEHARKALARRKQRCAELEKRLCADVGEHTRNCKFVRETTPKFEPDRCIKMLAGYADVLQNLEQRNAQYRLSAAQAAKLSAGDPPALGAPDAKLQLVEFIDFANNYGVQGAAVVRELRAKYGPQLRVVVHLFPLPDEPNAELAAEAALAAHAQGKFWEFHDRLFAHPHELDRAALLQHARAVGLDVGRFRAVLDSHAYRAAVAADLALVHELSITAMPAMFLNGERMVNAVDRESIVDAIDELLATDSASPPP